MNPWRPADPGFVRRGLQGPGARRSERRRSSNGQPGEHCAPGRGKPDREHRQGEPAEPWGSAPDAPGRRPRRACCRSAHRTPGSGLDLPRLRRRADDHTHLNQPRNSCATGTKGNPVPELSQAAFGESGPREQLRQRDPQAWRGGGSSLFPSALPLAYALSHPHHHSPAGPAH